MHSSTAPSFRSGIPVAYFSCSSQLVTLTGKDQTTRSGNSEQAANWGKQGTS